eukprot:COSAG06_NODE_5576_length_3392_cov_63.026067_2_plen_224_part_00
MHIHAAARMRRSARFASPPPFSLPRALEGPPDLQVRVAPVAVAPARLVGVATVHGALAAVGGVAGRTVEANAEVITRLAKAWPAGWADVLVASGGLVPLEAGAAAGERDATLTSGFVALWLAGAQPINVVAAGEAVYTEVAVAAIPLNSTAPFIGPAPLRLGTTSHTRTHTQQRPARQKTQKGRHGRGQLVSTAWTDTWQYRCGQSADETAAQAPDLYAKPDL